jgi:hypothetical protein
MREVNQIVAKARAERGNRADKTDKREQIR